MVEARRRRSWLFEERFRREREEAEIERGVGEVDSGVAGVWTSRGMARLLEEVVGLVLSPLLS